MKWFGEILLAIVLGLALAALLTASAAYGLPGSLGATAGSSSSVRPPLACTSSGNKASIWPGKPQAKILPALLDKPAVAPVHSKPLEQLAEAPALPQIATDQAAEPKIRRGEIKFSPNAKEATAVPKQFQLEAATFKFEETPQPSAASDLHWSLVTFPSPVHTSHERNNTVHCEFYRPAGVATATHAKTPAPQKTRYPACIVLHILGGDFPLSRAFAAALAKRNVAALFVIMPYYGPRRDPDGPARMISPDPEETVRGMTQAVKDIRYATAWLAEQPEVDPQQLGVFGISLGGITAALAGEAEPRLGKVCPSLAGGDIGSILWDATEKHMVETRRLWGARGNSRQSLVDLLSAVDPVTYADRLHDRKVLMLNASHDEIIPPQCTESLWKAAGKPRIVWYDAGHVTAALHILDAMQQVTDFFQPDAATMPEKKVKSSAANSPAVAGQRPN